jgi:hypothetical protein
MTKASDWVRTRGDSENLLRSSIARTPRVPLLSVLVSSV